MSLEELMTLICDELGLDETAFNEETPFENIVGDEFELQELTETICQELGIDLQTAPQLEWTVSDLAEAISEAY
ncbi:MAG: phosphopantetheine-binding protein [Clostridia bacterium]|nr:phosphopantetheine-binding protein [Clostridia bacterium]